jgi:DNA-binding ferritin-like protein
MANSPFSLSKILGWLKSFLSQLPCPIEGFNMRDVKVKEDGDGDAFSSLFVFSANPSTSETYSVGDRTYHYNGQNLTDVEGNPIDVNVLLRATNIKAVFAPILTGINAMNPENIKKANPLLDVLLGTDRPDNYYHQNNGKGLLGVNLAKEGALKYQATSYGGKNWTWGYIADDYLKYGLECEAPGKEPGYIENQTLDKCGKLIAEYLVDQEIITNPSELKIDIYTFALPILVRIQAWLAEYYDAACKKYLGKTETVDEKYKTEEGIQEVAQIADSTKQINVTLQKITGTTSFYMTAIKANYNPTEVLTDLDEVVGQDEFIDTLSEEPTTYEIKVDDEGFDIEPCEECMEASPCESLCEVFKAGIRAYRNLYIIHWLAKGNDMMKLHTMAEEMYGELIQEIDVVGELLVEKQGTVPQLDFPCDYVPVQDYDFQTGLDQIQSLIQTYIDCIDYAYCNQDSDVQSTLDEWLRYWKKQLNYFVERQEV